jgi:hypothetical protein
MKSVKILKLESIIVASIFLLGSLSFVSITLGGDDIAINNYNFTVHQSDESGLDLSLSIEGFSGNVVEVEGMTYDKLQLSNCGYTADYGKAELPTVSFYVAVPQDAEIIIDYDVTNYMVLQDYDIYPSQPPKPETDGYIDPPFTKNESFYETNEFYPSDVVEIGSYFTMRGCRIAMISVFPFSYNPVTKDIKFYNQVSLNINFNGGTGEFIPERFRSIFFQPIFDAYLINANIVERPRLKIPHLSRGFLSQENRADLLIVVYDDFYDEIIPLAEWRHLTGIETKIVNWSDIGTTAEDLRNYMNDAYNNWELPPSFLLIVGDADHIPVNYLFTHPYHGTSTGTDHWYVALEGDDYLPELHTGRISVEDADELNIVVNKILDYSKTPYMDVNWFDDVLLAAKEEGGRYFVYTSERIYEFLNPLGYNCNRQYVYTTPPGSTQGVIDAINNGVIIANHRDHGAAENDGYSYTGWSSPQFDTNHIQNDLSNGEMYSIMFALHCDSGWFDGETDSNSGNWESIGEVGIRVANKGFVAVIASSRVSYSGYNDEFCCGLFDAMWEDFDPDYPNGGSATPYNTEVYRISQVMNFGKFWMYDKYIVPGGCDPYPWTPSDDASRVEFEMFHVHGDPTMEVWTEFPQDQTVDHPDMVQYGGSIVEVIVESNGNPLEGALVSICQETGGAYAKNLTDSSGLAELEINIESPDNVTIIVTAPNHLYYSGTMQVGSSYPPDPPIVNGTTVGKPEKEYEYTATTTDPEEDQILYLFDWGDGTYSDWLGPYNSGESVITSHAWSEVGNYNITVRAKDINDSIGYWSDPYPMQIDLPVVDIINIKGGLFRITSEIENTGIAEAEEINWKITLDGGFILMGKETTGSIDTILAGKGENITSDMIFGLGSTRVYVTVEMPEGTDERDQGGYILLFFIRVNPGGS